jgi:GNAT superfamily N-acetyltransferase
VKVAIGPARRADDIEDFVALPYELHANDPHWVAPLRRDVRAVLAPTNPFFEHAEAQHFLARVGDRVVGRITAIHNRLHDETYGDGVGFFGFFETIEDRGVATELLATAAGWLRARGLTTLRGPASFSTNDECGLLVEGFSTPPTILMTHNPPHYAGALEFAGFRKAKDLLVYQTTAGAVPERLEEGAIHLQQRYSVTVRGMDMARYEQEVALVKRLYNVAWERNWGFLPLTDHEIEDLAKRLRPVVDKDLVVFAERAGEPIGFAVALPDFNVALARNRSGTLFPGLLKVLWAARRIDRMRVVLLGTSPEWRGRGVDALLYKALWDRARSKGYRWAEAGWILEDNHAMRNALVRMGFQPYKRYRLYDRPL